MSEMLSEVAHKEMLENLEVIVRSDRVFENVYDSDSPEVIEWTNMFYKMANVDKIFEETWMRLKFRSKTKAAVIGTFWHHFSSLAPKVMSIASAQVSNNLMRHYIVQIIFEELGSRNHRLIHPDLFLDCLQQIGITDHDRINLISKNLSKFPFEYLKTIMTNASTDGMSLGILLDLEIDAEENIQTLFDALSYDEESSELVEKSSFFRIHKIAEKEHIRLNVANFLRFCPSEESKSEFLSGFNQAVHFWRLYWNAINEVIDQGHLA